MKNKVLIIGAGTMGSGIAIVFAGNDYEVTLVDRTEEMALKAKERNTEIVSELINKDYFSNDWLDKIQNNIIYKGEDLLPELVPNAQLIVESVFENIDVKKTLYKKLNQYLSPDCIICSNTSALNVFDAAELSHPENFLITHWFNPPYIMELVEIVRGPKTSDEVVDKVKEILQNIGKKPSVINQYIPGFIVNRLGAALMREASYMVSQGWTTAEDIDSAMALTCGLRYSFEGPMGLYDVVGWDIIQAGALAMYPSLCNESDNGNILARKLIEQGDLGVSTGKGIFDYTQVPAKEYFATRTDKIIAMQKYINQFFDEFGN